MATNTYVGISEGNNPFTDQSNSNVLRENTGHQIVHAGLTNSFIGGTLKNTARTNTDYQQAGFAEDLGGVWTPSNLRHFDSPENGALRYIGSNPINFEVSWLFEVEGAQNSSYDLFLMHVKALGGIPEIVSTQEHAVLNVHGGYHLAALSGTAPVTLEQNDFLLFQIANLDSTSQSFLRPGGLWFVTER